MKKSKKNINTLYMKIIPYLELQKKATRWEKGPLSMCK